MSISLRYYCRSGSVEANLQLFWHTSTCTAGCKTFDRAEESSPSPASAMSRGCYRYQWLHASRDPWNKMSAEDVGEISPTSSGAALGPAKRTVEGKQVRGKGNLLIQLEMFPVYLSFCTILPWDFLLDLVVAVYNLLHYACSSGYTYSREKELVDSLALRQEGFWDMQGGLVILVSQPLLTSWYRGWYIVGDCLSRELFRWLVPLPASYLHSSFLYVPSFMQYTYVVMCNVCCTCRHCTQPLVWGLSSLKKKNKQNKTG